jgi:hypothetical protein
VGLGEFGRVDYHHAIDAGCQRALQRGLAIGVELLVVYVTVRID